MEMADEITILRKGRVIAQIKTEEVESRRELARLMVGREVVLRVEKEPIPPVLRFSNFGTVRDMTTEAIKPSNILPLREKRGDPFHCGCGWEWTNRTLWKPSWD